MSEIWVFGFFVALGVAVDRYIRWSGGYRALASRWFLEDKE